MFAASWRSFLTVVGCCSMAAFSYRVSSSRVRFLSVSSITQVFDLKVLALLADNLIKLISFLGELLLLLLGSRFGSDGGLVILDHSL